MYYFSPLNGPFSLNVDPPTPEMGPFHITKIFWGTDTKLLRYFYLHFCLFVYNLYIQIMSHPRTPWKNRAPYHKGLRLIAGFLDTWIAIELRLMSIVRLIATLCETGPRSILKWDLKWAIHRYVPINFMFWYVSFIMISSSITRIYA